MAYKTRFFKGKEINAQFHINAPVKQEEIKINLEGGRKKKFKKIKNSYLRHRSWYFKVYSIRTIFKTDIYHLRWG